MSNSFNSRSTLDANGKTYQIFSLKALEPEYNVSRLPFSLKILLENLLRFEDGVNVKPGDIEALANWDPGTEPSDEIAFTPARVVLQDFTGVPAVVDLAAMREAMRELGGDPKRINPLSPAELVVDHSVQVDKFGQMESLKQNTEIEFERNRERYGFLRWGQQAFDNFKVVPPGTGIIHQVNIEYLARVVFANQNQDVLSAYPDTLVGTDSHTTMVNGLGVLGWGVGGIEAEAGMLGQPITMLIPNVVGFRLKGKLPPGTTATDLVLTVTEILRKKGVVGKFVEFFGDGLDNLTLADRATIANMAPEYGATCGIFPIDQETLRYLELTGRSAEQVKLVEAYAQAQGMFRNSGDPEPQFSDLAELDLADVEPSLAGPKRPQDRVPLRQAKDAFAQALSAMTETAAADAGKNSIAVTDGSQQYELRDGSIVIAAITSCTNTSNPSVLVAAGLLAQKAIARGLQCKPWVKTSLAPGSLVVTEYLRRAQLLGSLETLGFNLVGYGCTTCIGNSGPLPEAISKAIIDGNLVTASVLSGNRNFEGRIHPQIRMNYLASPPLVVAYALAGTMNVDLNNEPLGSDAQGNPVFLADIWPDNTEIQEIVQKTIAAEMFNQTYDSVYSGDSQWQQLSVSESELYDWESDSTYIRKPTFFDGMGSQPEELKPIENARVLALLGDSVTTDHISPAGSIPADGPAGKYLIDNGVEPRNFNSFGSRRGNHEVMMRGTFANIRLRNQLAPGTEGGWTVHQPSGEQTSIYDASMRYQNDGVPLMVIAGKEYGTGSSRDWAAKGTRLLGVRAVIAETYERIHRSNLIGMGVLPLQFNDGDNAQSLGLNGTESYTIEGLRKDARQVTIAVAPDNGAPRRFEAQVRIDTPKEWDYYLNDGILHYVLRQLAG